MTSQQRCMVNAGRCGAKRHHWSNTALFAAARGVRIALTEKPNSTGEPSSELISVLVSSDTTESAQVVENGLGTDARLVRCQLAVTDHVLARLKLERPDVLVITRSSATKDLIDFISAVVEVRPLPIVVFVSVADSEDTRAAVRAGATAFIVDGLTPPRVRSVIDVAIERFRLNTALHDELQKSKDDLAARKTIERAKGLLMERRGISEQEAYDAIRKSAMAQGKPMLDVATAILSISDLLP